jgi:hypothetical protein
VRLLSAPWSSRRRVRFRVRVDRFPRRAVKGDAFSLDRDQASSSTRAKKGPRVAIDRGPLQFWIESGTLQTAAASVCEILHTPDRDMPAGL